MMPKCSVIALAVLSTLSSVSYADAYQFTEDTTIEEPLSASQVIQPGGGGYTSSVLMTGEGTNVALLGATISSEMTVNRSWDQLNDKGGNTNYTFSAICAGSMDGENGGTLTLGGSETESIQLNVYVNGTGTVKNKDGGTSAVGLGAVGLWALNNYVEPDLQTNNGGHIVVTAKDLSINVHSEHGSAYGILAQNSTTVSTAQTPSTVEINAENTRIVATSGEDGSASALVAFSEGVLKVNGNLYASGKDAIVARGDAVVRINESNTKTVQLVGDIDFNYDKKTSGTSVDADVLVNLTGKDSFWTGSAKSSYGTGAAPDGGMMTVSGLQLGLSDGAQWNPTVVEESADEETGTAAIAINQLSMNDGVINLQTAGQSVAVDTLTGTGGTVNVAAEAEEGGAFTTANLSIAKVDTTEAAPALAVNYTGITADDLSSDAAADLETLAAQSLSFADGTAVAQTRTVAEGDIRGAVTQAVSETGEVTGTTEAANTKLTDFSSVNAMSLVQWRNEINHLTKRLGDIRASEGTIGAWARVYGGESQWGGANEVEMDHTTIQVGGDYRINNHWIAGAAFSYTDSRADLANGDADGDSYSLAVYGTYTADGGSFLDLIGRYGYLKNDITAGNMALDTSSSAFSLSAEMGHTFRFINDAAYVEPQIEFTYGFIGGDDATASNGVRIEQDDFQSFVTRVGVRAGYDFPQKKGSVYGMFSYSYDWMGDADGTASKGDLRQALSQDLGGGWVTYGVGAQIMLGDSAYFYGELERTSGGDIDNPYQFSAGVRMTF